MARAADPELADRRRREILDAALACFRRSGFHQTGMQAICAEAAISPGALYRYFSSKAEIIAAIAQENREEVAALLDGALTSGRLMDGLMRCAARIFERHMGDNSSALVAEVLGEAVRDPDLGARLARIDDQAQAQLAHAIAKAQARGEVDGALDPAVASFVLFSAMDGLALRLSIFRTVDVLTGLDDFRTLAQRYLSPRGHEG